ncbi:MAG: hypothetical protein KC502_21080 [Myxococcales bacterium]|nr:hypothetical protein [Myxococcales bacterium]
MVELLDMTRYELFIVGLTMLLCVSGLLLPRFGNKIGRAMIGEDPEVTGWRKAWASRRVLRRDQRVARKDARRQRKAERKAAKLARKKGVPTTDEPQP